MLKQVQMTALTIAAQADLLAATVEMLRPPQSTKGISVPSWLVISLEEYQALVERAFVSREGREARGALQVVNLHEMLASLYRLNSQLDWELWSDEYWRLFGGAQICPLNQASYIRRDKGAILGDLAGFYLAFGWQSNPENGERPDHLLSQLEFASMLLAMLAMAKTDDQRGVTADALGEFHRLHMADWLPSLCGHLRNVTTLEYFVMLGTWLDELWSALACRHEWPSDPSVERNLLPRVDPEDPYECGAPDLVTLKAASSPAVYAEAKQTLE
jgi:TorA maturation chaperone TorD